MSLRRRARQSNFMFDADAWEQVRKTNDQVKVQAKHTPELATIFKQLIDYFARSPRAPKAPAGGNEGGSHQGG